MGCKAIIIVQGYLASGKSTFARRLSEKLAVPCFVKDTFKIALCASVPIDNREESSRFSAVTFDAMMYAAEKLMEAGYPVIVEGNFVPAGVKAVNEADVIRSLIEKHAYKPLTYRFIGDTRVLHERFVKREGSAERGRVNTMFSEVLYDDFNRWCLNLDGFNVGGEVITVETTDFNKVDFEKLFCAAQRFIEAA